MESRIETEIEAVGLVSFSLMYSYVLGCIFVNQIIHCIIFLLLCLLAALMEFIFTRSLKGSSPASATMLKAKPAA